MEFDLKEFSTKTSYPQESAIASQVLTNVSFFLVVSCAYRYSNQVITIAAIILNLVCDKKTMQLPMRMMMLSLTPTGSFLTSTYRLHCGHSQEMWDKVYPNTSAIIANLKLNSNIKHSMIQKNKGCADSGRGSIVQIGHFGRTD